MDRRACSRVRIPGSDRAAVAPASVGRNIGPRPRAIEGARGLDFLHHADGLARRRRAARKRHRQTAPGQTAGGGLMRHVAASGTIESLLGGAVLDDVPRRQPMGAGRSPKAGDQANKVPSPRWWPVPVA